jgi:hypothetical protein
MVLGALTGAGEAKAKGTQGKPQEFVPTELTEKEREAARVRARYHMGVYREDEDLPPETRFPWVQLGATLLTFAVVSPFAWSAYKRHVGEAPAALDKPRRRLIRKNNAAP